MMDWFKEKEFDLTEYGGEDWFDKMMPEVISSLDKTRSRHGRRIDISPVRGALGRRLGPFSSSDHNYDKWKEVRCSDVFPSGIKTPDDAKLFEDIAISCGFNAIGIYPHWRNGRGRQQCGFHLGIRPGIHRIARWGFVRENLSSRQTMVSYYDAIRLVGVEIPK